MAEPEHQPYNPFKSPPNFLKARLHSRSCLVPNKTIPATGQCQCCKRSVHEYPLPICTSTKQLRFLGAEIPLLFYFIEVSLLLMMISVFVATGQFVACSINETCHADLLVDFYFDKVPVGYTDKSQSEFVPLIVLSIYTVVFTILQVRLRSKMFQMQRSHSNVFVMLINVPKQATRGQIRHLLEDRGYRVQEVYMPKKLRPWLKVMREKFRVKKEHIRALQKRELIKAGEWLVELREIDENLETYKRLNQNEQMYRTSYVVVKMATEDQAKQFLKKTDIGLFTKLWYKLCTCCSPLKLHSQHISAVAAPPPKDIIWQNLQAPYLRTWLKRLMSYLIAFSLVVIASFGSLYLLTREAVDFWENVGGSLLIQLTNLILVEFLEWSATFQDDLTHTNAKISLTFKLTFFQFLNVTLMPFVVFAYRVFYQQSGTEAEKRALNEMTTSVVFIYLGNLLKPLLMVFSVQRVLREWRRRSALKKGVLSQLSQYQANLLFEPVEFHIEYFYSAVVASLMGTFFYLSLLPSVVLVQLLLLFMVLIAGRHLLLKVCKQPKHFTSLLIRSVNKLTQLCLLMFWLGRVTFRIMLSDPKNFSGRMQTLWEDLYFKIQIGVLGAYLLLVYFFNCDERLGRRINNIRKPTQQSLIENIGDTILGMGYNDVHSFIGLVEQGNIQMGYDHPLDPQAEPNIQYPDFD